MSSKEFIDKYGVNGIKTVVNVLRVLNLIITAELSRIKN